MLRLGFGDQAGAIAGLEPKRIVLFFVFESIFLILFRYSYSICFFHYLVKMVQGFFSSCFALVVDYHRPSGLHFLFSHKGRPVILKAYEFSISEAIFMERLETTKRLGFRHFLFAGNQKEL